MKSVLELISYNLVSLRKQNNLTQLELSQKINYSDKAISRWEKGEVTPSIEILSSLADVYGVPLTYFFEEHIDAQTAKIKEREKNLYILIMISLMLIIWTVAVIVFFVIKSASSRYYASPFIWALPVSSYAFGWCNKRFFKKNIFLITSSITFWLLMAAIYCQWIQHNIWQIFLLGIPVQITLILIEFARKIRKQPNIKK